MSRGELLLSCDCYDYHYVEFWYDTEFGMTVSFIERPIRFQDKLRAIWKIIQGEDYYSGELIINPEDYAKLAKYLKKGLKEKEKI